MASSSKITAQLTAHYGQDHIHFIDGFPIPVCRYSRAKRHKNFKEHAGFSYCAAQQEKYYGFKGHLVINLEGMITGYTFAPANVMSVMLHQKSQKIFMGY